MSISETPKPKQRSAKIKALLAGGLIAGLGITATLASWNTGALGEWFVAGSDAGVVIELQDQNGNWVGTDEEGNAPLLNDLTMSSFQDSEDGSRSTGWAENRIRISGLGESEEFTLTTALAGATENAALNKAFVEGFIDLSDGTGSCADVAQADRHELVADGFGATQVDFLPIASQGNPISLTGDFEARLCMEGHTTSDNSGKIRADDTLSLIGNFQAAKES